MLALCGDDPGAKSSSIAHQSEHALIHCGIPILNPSSVQEYLDFGLAGFALSRFSGCWVGAEVPHRHRGQRGLRRGRPGARALRRAGLPARSRLPHRLEQPAGRGREAALPAAPAGRAGVRARERARSRGARRAAAPARHRHHRQGLPRRARGARRARHRRRAAPASSGSRSTRWRSRGRSSPKARSRSAAGSTTCSSSKRSAWCIEDQLARLLYNQSQRPRLAGKRDASGAPLVPAEGELAPGAGRRADPPLARERRARRGRAPRARRRPRRRRRRPASSSRLPAFCSGCPHNTSTVVPEDSIALGGIGCHGMAAWMPERRTLARHADGRRGRQLDRAGAVHVPAAPLPEHGRRHLLPLRPPRDPRRRRGQGERHLQAPRERRRRDDGRPADRGRADGGRDHLPRDRAPARGRGRDARSRSSRSSPRSSRPARSPPASRSTTATTSPRCRRSCARCRASRPSSTTRPARPRRGACASAASSRTRTGAS